MNPGVVSPARRPRHAIPPSARRAIAQLSRRAHRFHRFAHHPLCGAYAGEVIRVGKRTRLCRGCTYAILGGVAGGLAGLALGASTRWPMIAIAGGVTCLLATLWLRRRVSKLVTRLAPAALFAFAITGGVRSLGAGSVRGAIAAAVAIASVAGLRWLYGRRGPDRRACVTCPERDHSPCSGFAPIVSRERAFQRVVRRLVSRR
jgi:hypothetical protein